MIICYSAVLSFSVLLLFVLLALLSRWRIVSEIEAFQWVSLCYKHTHLMKNSLRASNGILLHYFASVYIAYLSPLTYFHWPNELAPKWETIKYKCRSVLLLYFLIWILLFHSLFWILLHRIYMLICNFWHLSFISWYLFIFLTFINDKQIFVPFLYFLTQYHAQQDMVCFIISIRWLLLNRQSTIKIPFFKGKCSVRENTLLWKHRNWWK